MVKEKSIPNPSKEVLPQYLDFEGIKIQWNKVPWNFEHPEKGAISIDTYSVWNTAHHAEIADRLIAGERCALYMMGNFGVGQFFQGEGSEDFEILDKVKQRERLQNLCVFAHPSDIGEFLDTQRLPVEFLNLATTEGRNELYPGPMHAILPINEDEMPNTGLIQEADKSAAFFWIPGHTGYEQLVAEIKTRDVKGLFGGGSLNIHGQEPSFTTQKLKEEMKKHLMWQEGVQFIIFDELAEAEGIGRSHTQISFLEHPPRVLRIGSLTPEAISLHIQKPLIQNPDGTKLASSTSPYDVFSNLLIERRIKSAIARMQRFAKSTMSI